MQRLLRYPMLLERYKKEAELENVDKCFINEIDLAIRSIKVLSGEANEAKRTTDGYANLARIFHEIEGKNSIEKSGSKRNINFRLSGHIVQCKAETDYRSKGRCSCQLCHVESWRQN